MSDEYLDIFALLVARDGPLCYVKGCRAEGSEDDPLEIEHYIPKASGRDDIDIDDLDNLRLAHHSCNNKKGTAGVGDGRNDGVVSG